MKKYLHFLLLLTTIFLVACQEKTKTKTVYQNPGTTIGGSTGQSCYGTGYWTTPGCQGYDLCQTNPSISSYCTGSTTGTTSSGSTGGTNPSTGMCTQYPNSAFCQPNYCGTSGNLPYGCIISGGVRVNCYIKPTTPGCGGATVKVPHNPNWGVWYPQCSINPQTGQPYTQCVDGVPSGSCSSTYVPTPLTEAFDTRIGTVTIPGAGRDGNAPATNYDPVLTNSSHYYNTSEQLTSLEGVKQFYLTDAILKARIKVLPEPKAVNDYSVCKGRGFADGGGGSYIPGYTKLQYDVYAHGLLSSGVIAPNPKYLGTYTTSINNCSPAINLSSIQESYPFGVFLTIQNIKENKDCGGGFWGPTGWQNCNEFNKVRSMECLRFEIEVAADGTKTFN